MTTDFAIGLTFCWLIGCLVATAGTLVLRLPAVSAWRLFVLALVVRLIPCLIFRMPEDALARFDLESLRLVAQLVRSGQEVYGHTTRHPYLPLQMYLDAAAGWLAQQTGAAFEVVHKFPGIIADAVIPAILGHWRTPSAPRETAQRAAWAYTFNPLSIVLVAVHVQFDSLPLLFLMLALRLLAMHSTARNTPVRSGLLFGWAVLAKVWPIIVLPVAFFRLEGWRRRAGFLAALAVVPLSAVLGYCVLFGTLPTTMVTAVTAYGAQPRTWGYRVLLRKAYGLWGWAWAGRVYDWVEPNGGWILGICLVAATLVARTKSLERGCTMVILAFYSFAYGWGMHYLTWALPLILLSASPGLAAAYVLSASLLVMINFFALGGFYFGAVRFVAADSAVLRYAWTLPVSMWMLCAVLFGTGVYARGVPRRRRK